MTGNYILHHLVDGGKAELKDGTLVELKEKPHKDKNGEYWFNVLSNKTPYQQNLVQKDLEEMLRDAKAIIHGARV